MNVLRRTLGLTTAVFFIVFPAFGMGIKVESDENDSGSGAAQVAENYDAVLPAGGLEKLHLENADGSIRITPAAAEEIKIAAVKKVKAKTKEAAEQFAKELITVTTEGDTLKVITGGKKKPPEVKWFSVDYEIALPGRFRAEISNVNGKIKVEPGLGEAKLSTVNGTVEARGVKGEVSINTVNGAVTVDDAGGPVQIATVNGSIGAFRNRGSVVASTVNGKTKVTFAASNFGRCDLSSLNGSLGVYFPERVSAEIINASTVGGYIELQFPLRGGNGETGRLTRKHVQGRIGEGEGTETIALSTLNGRIYIRKFKGDGGQESPD